MKTIETQLTVGAQLTPEHVARLFCDMHDSQQAAFFTECKRISDTEFQSGGMFVQALWIAKKMPVGTPGADFLMDLAAPWYTHTLMYIDTHGEKERA